MHCEITGNPDQGITKCHKIPSEPLQGQTGVIKFNFLYFTKYLQKYFLKSYKTSLNYSAELFKPRDVAFCPLLVFPRKCYYPKCVRFSLALYIINYSNYAMLYAIKQGFQF